MHTMALLEVKLNTTSQHVTQKQEDQTEHLEKCDLSSGESREIWWNTTSCLQPPPLPKLGF